MFPIKLGPKFAPYIDVTSSQALALSQYKQQTGVNAFTLAFLLTRNGCANPSWGWVPLTDSNVITQVNNFKASGGQIIVSSGGASAGDPPGDFLERACASADDLASAYIKGLSAIGSGHLDIDVETAGIDVNKVALACAKVQQQRPGTTISFTIAADQNGPNSLGKSLLQAAKNNGVVVDVVNPMCMEFIPPNGNMGDGVIACAKSTMSAIQQYWPGAGYGMLGVCPMVGSNINGVVFSTDDARKLLQWSQSVGVGRLSFWEYYRDSKTYGNAYTNIMVAYSGGGGGGTPGTTQAPTTTVPSGGGGSCTNGQFYSAGACSGTFYQCSNNVKVAKSCSPGLVWNTNGYCDYPSNVPGCQG